jgi:hypothetical protein
MIGIINPALLLIPIAAIVVLIFPTLVSRWRRYVAYAVLSNVVTFSLWYFSDVHAVAIKLFGVTNFLGTVIGMVVQMARDQAQGAANFQLQALFLAMLLLTLVGGPIALERYRETSQRGLLPSGLMIGRATYMPRKLNASCEISTWELLPVGAGNSSPSILTSSQKAMSSRQGELIYSAWAATPLSSNSDPLASADRWLRGIGCSEIDSAQKDLVIDALTSEGAFYATSGDAGVVLIPKQHLVVHSYSR